MDNESRKNFGFRKMFKGKWTCAQCGGEITELPFEPSPERLDQLYCKECWMKRRKGKFGS